MIKAVIFDLDETLLDRTTSLNKFINSQYMRLFSNLGMDKQKFIRRFIELDNKGYVWKDQVYQQLIKEFSLDSFRWEELLEDYKEQFSLHCVPFPNLIELLSYLQENNYKIGLISNGFTMFQLDNFEQLHIKNYFDCILISEAEGIKKPDIRIFQRAATLLEVSPKECLFVGDHYINDIQGAINAGMSAILKNNDYDPNYQGSQVSNLIDIIKYLKK